MKKKILTLGLVLAMAVSMTACGTKTETAASAEASAPAESTLSGTINVFAAASMTESLDKVIAEFEKENPNVDVVATYDSSGTLKTQIASGADCDVFISAAQKQMNAIDEEKGGDAYEGTNFVMPGTRADILENKCVLITSPSSDKKITDWDSFQSAITSAKSSSDLIFAMGNADVPVGKYTSAILKSLNLNEEDMVKAGIVTYGSNVKEVLTTVQEGTADCGIVYETDAFSAGVTPVATADTELTGGPCIYPAAVMANTKNEEAAKTFLEYIQSEKAMKEFTAVGFKEVAAK